jgi:hypothetical protein
MGSGHRVIIASSLREDLRSAKTADAGGRRRLVVHRLGVAPRPAHQPVPAPAGVMPSPVRAAALRPGTADPGQAASCPLLNPLPPGPGPSWAGFGGHRAHRARPTPPSNSGGCWAAPDAKTKGGRFAPARVKSPPHPPRTWGGLNPPRPLPGGAEGGASLPRSGGRSHRPPRSLAGRQPARAIGPTGILPRGRAGIVPARRSRGRGTARPSLGCRAGADKL